MRNKVGENIIHVITANYAVFFSLMMIKFYSTACCKSIFGFSLRM